MNKCYFAGIDVGTTGVKVMLFDIVGNAVSQSYREYGCSYPRPGWVEQDCALLIDAVYDCCNRAIRGGGIRGCEIHGVSISAQRSSTVLLDRAGQPLKMISWLDNRATAQVDAIAEKVGQDRFYDITGLPLSTTWILPKVLYIREHEPALWEKTAHIAQLHDVIARALGAEVYVSDEAEAAFFGLWDNRELCYSEELLRAFSIDRSMLPEIRPSGEVMGKISAAVAERTGFSEGTPICVGIGDQNSAAVGAGIVREGDVSVSLGTGGLATVLLQSCYRDPNRKSMVTSHACRGMWTYEGLQNAAAGAFRWFRDEIAALEKYEANEQGIGSYDILNSMIASTPVGARGLLMLPYLAGSAAPRWDPTARGCFIGLTLAHDRACMARACVEGITLEQKDILSGIAAQGVKMDRVRIVGGATQSEIWNQIQADVYGLPCETLAITDAAALGAAISAGVGTGVFSSIAEGISYMVHVGKRYEPIRTNTEKYEALYHIYCDTYDTLRAADIFARLSAWK